MNWFKVFQALDPGTSLSVWNLLTATAALLAFLIGLLGLIGRDRKSPYLINTIISTFLFCLIGAGIDLLSLVIPHPYGWAALWIGLIVLLFAFCSAIVKTYNIYVRLHFFVDRIHINEFPVVRPIRRWLKSIDTKASYEHDPLNFAEQVKSGLPEFLKAKGADVRRANDMRSLCMRTGHLQQATNYLVELAILFLRNGMSVQYLTASRHPIEFVQDLKAALQAEGLELSRVAAKQLVVIDAYSPHYAFLDSIYQKKGRELSQLGVTCVDAKMSYAGLHTASARAFKVLKKKANSPNRDATLVVYEDPYALADLESVEQYRLFVRHVLPSERLWGGMFTVFVETAQPDGDWDVVQSYADAVIEFQGAPSGAQTR